MCGRTATIETWCNDDGSRTAVLYSYQANVLVNSTYQPFEDVAVLKYNGDRFELTYGNKTSTISLLVISSGKETAINGTGLNVTPIIKKQRGGFEYGVSLDNASAMDSLKFKIGGDDIKGIKYDFSDTVTNGTSLTSLDSKTFIVNNDKAAKQLIIDPSITLNDTNSGNAGDTYADQSNPATNYGTATTMKAAAGSPNQTAYIAFYLGGLSYPANARILDAQLGLWKTDTTGVPTTLTCRNTTYFSESALTWNNKPADLTTQQAISSGTANGEWKYWNVTNGTQAALYNANQTVYLLVNNSQYVWDFYTKDNADTAHRPQLVITYTSGALEPAAGLVGYWKLDDNTGLTTFDSSGNNNYGTLYNSPTWTTGKNYQTPYALSFNGVNQYVQTANNIGINGTTARTICAWVNPTSTTAHETVAGWGSQAANSQFYLGTDSGMWAIGWYGSAALFGTVYASWNHICTTYNGTDILTYQNGIYKTDTAVSLTTADTKVNIGIWGDNSSIPFSGNIDNVKIWNRVLSDPEIWAEALYYCPYISPTYLDYIAVYNESNPWPAAAIGNTITLSNSTSTYTNTYGSGAYFTDYTCNSSVPTGAVTVSVSNSSFYSPRNYYINTVLGQSVGFNTYLLPLSDPYPILTNIQVISSSGYAIQNTLITVQRQFSGTWTTIAQKYTDSTGIAGFNFDYQTQYFLIVNASGYPVAYWSITPTSQTYRIFLAPSAQVRLSQIFSQISSGCYVDNSSYPTSVSINCSVNDSSGQLQSVNLYVHSLGTYGSVTICNVNDNTANFTLNCTISNPTNQTITFTLTGYTSSTYGVLVQDSFNFGSQALFNNGLFPAFLLSLTMGLLGLFVNPALGIAGYGSGWIFSALMGLIYIPPVGIGALIVICGLLIYVLRT